MNEKIFLNQAIELCEQNIDSTFHNITMLSNISSLIYNSFSNLNWAGFYLVENNNLVLGPFQGKVACSFILYGKGVCGTCLEKKESIYVENVHEFPGHIACDSASNSELVIPIIVNEMVIGVLDIDSFLFNRFNKEEIQLLKELVNILSKYYK